MILCVTLFVGDFTTASISFSTNLLKVARVGCGAPGGIKVDFILERVISPYVSGASFITKEMLEVELSVEFKRVNFKMEGIHFVSGGK